MNAALEAYTSLVDFLADYLGDNTEVVLHDLTDLEHSIVKIRNGHISGRQEGDPCTDLVLRIMQKTPSDTQYETNYSSTKQNESPLKSGSFYIRNAEQKIIGMLCINMETAFYSKMRAYLDSFFGIPPQDAPHSSDKLVQENLGMSLGEMMDATLTRVINECGCDPKLLSHEGKEQLIEKLNEEGIFLLKGSIGKAATALGLSEPSIYRYLNKLKKD